MLLKGRAMQVTHATSHDGLLELASYTDKRENKQENK